MYIRQQFKTVAGERRAYWALVESVRTERGPRQKVVSWLGALDEAGRLGVLQAAQCPAKNQATSWIALKIIEQLKLDEFLNKHMPKGKEAIQWSGNTVDVTTVKRIVETMGKRYGKSDRIWVMNRGMTSEDNLEFLRKENRRYIIGTQIGRAHV